MLTIYTIQMAQWRKAKQLRIELIDTTVKSGDYRLAPVWDIVTGIKTGAITEKEYTEKYKALMRQSIKQHQPFWRELLSKEAIALACYCPKDKFCHRHILVEIIVYCCKQLGIEYTLGGEL